MARKTISLSKHLGVNRADLEKKGVFDSVLGVDTKLFIDPKLLVNSDISEFVGSRKAILDYFARLIRIHKHSDKSPRLLAEAQQMLAVPEPIGLSIGYGNTTDRGTAISISLANKILLSITEILTVGIEDVELVEILGLFVSGFGPDSMSDLAVSIIYADFCNYTQRISKELGVKTQPYTINNIVYELPTHPFKGKQIIFIPFIFLRPLPLAVSWGDISQAAQHNRELRKEFNKIIFPVLEEALKDISSKSGDEKKEFKEQLGKLIDVYRKLEIKPYDLQKDDKGYYAIQPFVDLESDVIRPTSKPNTQDQLVINVRELIGQYQRSIEVNGGNKLLYRKTETGKL